MATPQLLIDAMLIPYVSNIDVDFAEAAAQQTGDGGEVSTRRTKGATVRARVEIGRDPGLYAVLVALHGGIVPHTITVNDPALGSLDLDVNWKSRPPLRIGLPGQFNAIELVFTERA